MRAILIAAVAGILAAGAATAHNNLGQNLSQPPQEQAAGVLTCTTKPELSLVFGKTPVVDCTFAAYRGGFRQSYVALLQAEAAEPYTDRVRTVTWRVMNHDGFARPGMLDGVFARRDAAGAARLAGQRASLVPLTQSAATGAGRVARTPGMALAATSKGFTHLEAVGGSPAEPEGASLGCPGPQTRLVAAKAASTSANSSQQAVR